MMLRSPSASASVVPPRKRRRPALSCAECRRRKIKCDRNSPCSQCLRFKSPRCTFIDEPSGHSRVAPNNTTAVIGSHQHYPVESHKSEWFATISGTDRSSGVIEPTPAAPPYYPLTPGSLSGTQAGQSHGMARIGVLRQEPLPSRPVRSEETGDECTKAAPDLERMQAGKQEKSRINVSQLRGTISKSRFYGRSHWMYMIEQFNHISFFRKEGVAPCENPFKSSGLTSIGEIRNLIEKCKIMARAAKSVRNKQWLKDQNFEGYVPGRELCDKLVNLYFKTFESTHRILHIPSFQKEYAQYWQDPGAANTGFVIQLLLIMAIGTCFYQEPDYKTLSFAAQQWVYAAQSWLSVPFEKDRFSLRGLQIYCLIILARENKAVGSDLIWISAGALIRMAMTMGFHRHPKYFPKMTILHAEMRRRIWATILEIAVQSSMDAGMQPMLSFDDFDVEAPSNIDDNQINENTTLPPVCKPAHVFTQASLQIALFNSVQLRLEIAKIVNDSRNDASYDDTLRLGHLITAAGREVALRFQSYDSSNQFPGPSMLQRNLVDIPVRRSLIALHYSFAIVSRTDPRFYFSRKVCLDAATTIFSYTGMDSFHPAIPEGYVDDYSYLKLVGGAFLKSVILHAAVIICLELISQLQEESPLSPAQRVARIPLHEYLEDIVEVSGKRIEMIEFNVKGHLFLSAIWAQIKAMENGEDPDRAIREAAKKSGEYCMGILKERAGLAQRIAPEAGIVMSDDWVVGGTNSGGEVDVDFGGIDMMLTENSLNFDVPDEWFFSSW